MVEPRMKKQILTGAESFEKIIEGNHFYIDKTLFIKELIENRGDVTLITRPRRFGKTLNLSMLAHFFDVRKDNKALFDGLKIMEHKDIVEKHMNRYPVVSLTLKNVELATFKDSMQKIMGLISAIFQENLYLCEGDSLNEFKRKKFFRYCSEEATEAELQSALEFLTSCLYAYHNKRVIVLLDEYDAPLNNAYLKGYYTEMIDFMRGFLGSVFKTNNNLEFGVLTGVQRISKESLISSFNNPLVCGVMDKEFNTCFGFTEEEVKDACQMYEISEKYDEIKKWYDGYRFGGQDMYNPWSIVSYLKKQELGEYWINTGSIQILQNVFYKGDDKLRNEMAALLTGSPVMMFLEDGISFPVKYVNSDTFWSMLLNAGYIKPCNGAKTDRFTAELVNMEIKNMFSRYAKKWFGESQPSIYETILEFVEHLRNGDPQAVSDTLNNDLLNNPSCHDFKMENSYHMFIYGILYALSGDYIVTSNQETGKGRTDCVIKPIDKTKNAVIVEFKHVKKVPSDDLNDALAAEAKNGIKQIDEKVYIHNLKREGYGQILKYGIAFHKKHCVVAMEKLCDNEKFRFSHIIILFLLLLFHSCTRQPEVPIKIDRMEQTLFTLPVDSISEYIPQLKRQYGELLEFFSFAIGIGLPDNPDYAENLKDFITYPDMKLSYEKIMAVFPDVKELERNFGKAFYNYSKHFPEREIPALYTFFSGFNNKGIVTANTMAIALDYYLGRDEEIYTWLGLQSYERQLRDRKYLVSDYMNAWVSTEFPFNDSISTVLANIIYRGKVMYAVHQLLPQTPDSLIFGYSPSQMRWCKENTAQMYTFLVERRLLFSTDQFTINKLVEPAPFTSTFTAASESPGRAAIWLGYRIVDAYMKREKITLEELLQNHDYQQILSQSRFKP